MIVTCASAIVDLLACPTCQNPLAYEDQSLMCRNGLCHQASAPFVTVKGKPVLVDFERSHLVHATVTAQDGASDVARHTRSGLVQRLLHGRNHSSRHFAKDLIGRLSTQRKKQTVLIIGGGTIGSGAEALYEDERIQVIAIDVYASPMVTIVADGHQLPFASGSIDAVWIQAVLEHTLDPAAIVAEVHRVLRPEGLVFANVAFLWPIVEQAYDYTRYTANGLRWLFRDFETLALGFSSGPGTGAVNALRYLAQSLFRHEKFGTLITIPFLWMRWLDRFCGNRRGLDAAPAPFIFARRSASPITHQQLFAFYDEQDALVRRSHRWRD